MGKQRLVRLKVVLNGTETNRWEAYGMRQNPFPQTGKGELDALERVVNSLDGEPIKSEDDIRNRLRGCTTEFVDLCVSAYRPGLRVEFSIQFPEELNG